MTDILIQQVAFIKEVDKLKTIIRRTRLMDNSRYENTAEHCWHVALMALTFVEHAEVSLDLARVVRMLLVHDIVEIDAGDTFAFDLAGHETKAAREQAAADRLFGLLPESDGTELRSLWDEFELGETPEARYAVAMDRFEPLLCNVSNGGGSWREHGVGREAVLRRMDPVRVGAPGLWSFVIQAIDGAVERGEIQR
jgi:putative hydrolases of HD superfamily